MVLGEMRPHIGGLKLLEYWFLADLADMGMVPIIF